MFYRSRTFYTPTLYYDVVSHTDLKPEKAESYEASYMGSIANINVTVNAYTMNVKDFVSLQYTAFWAPGAPRQLDFVNGGEAQITGSEIELQYQFMKWLNGLVNYTSNYSKEVTAPAAAFLTQTPANMANAEITAKFDNGITTRISANYVDKTVWKSVATWGAGGIADAYTIANLYIGYKLSPKAEISLAASDLFDYKYSEYPIAGMQIGRRVTGTVTYSF
jgi:outer membrane receptor protein involved in Fe transport